MGEIRIFAAVATALVAITTSAIVMGLRAVVVLRTGARQTPPGPLRNIPEGDDAYWEDGDRDGDGTPANRPATEPGFALVQVRAHAVVRHHLPGLLYSAG